MSTIVPIYKSGGRYNALNYRPISLTSVPCKVMERVIVKFLFAHIEGNSLLSEKQFGFRSRHSTIDNLILTYNDVTTSVDQCKVVDLIFFDFKKAFDRVSHAILSEKLVSIGIDSQIVDWIATFLMCRRMSVRVAGANSGSVGVTSGVPQGSVLGPVLFLIYVNHLSSFLNCKYMLFADDIKLYLSFDVTDLSYGVQMGQDEIDSLVRTSDAWGLKMNVSKCVCIRFSRRLHSLPFSDISPYSVNGTNIKCVQSHRDLGILISRDLKFHSHIKQIVTIANQLTSNIFSCTVCRDADFIINIYEYHVRPLLEYGSTLWNMNYIGDLKLLERVQRRWTRAVNGLENLPYNERLRHLNMFSLQGRFLRADLIFTWKIFHGHCSVKPNNIFNVATDSRTRGHRFKVITPVNNVYLRSRFFAVRVIPRWNALGPDTVEADSISSFKCLLHRDLGDALFDYMQ